jgi:hypothetical protein
LFGGLTFQENEKHLDLTQNSKNFKRLEERKQSSGDHHDLRNIKYEDGRWMKINW